MSVCTQPGCGTHTPPWVGWWVLDHQIHASMRSSEICVPGVTSAWSCGIKIWVVGACGRGTTCEKPVRVDVAEVFPEGGHQLARGRGSVDVVERLQFRVFEGICALLLWRSGGRGGA